MKEKSVLINHERQKKYMTVFMNGKQVRVRHPETIDEMGVGEFILTNLDPIWFHQNEMWEYIEHQQFQSEEEHEPHGFDKNNDEPF